MQVEEFLELSARRFPDKTALVSGAQRLSYREIEERSNRLAHGLIATGVRRREDALRSQNPLHPVLVCGPKAVWLIAGHERVAYSCGAGSPFEKMLELDTKVLFFDVPFAVFTFVHYLEDRFKQSAPVPVYQADPLEGKMTDEEGRQRILKLYVFNREAIRHRNFPVLQEVLRRDGRLKQDRIGNTSLMLVRTRDALQYAKKLVEQGIHLYQ